MKQRCINLDWLEIFAEEPANKPLDAEYFRASGYKVKERQYGTPQYREMFTLLADGHELFEIRRNPYSLKREGGIFNHNACHIRLCNRTCYEEAPIDHLRAFMIAHNYTYKSIARIDIALDFNLFDNNMKPENFIMQYMRGRISKVNQTNVSAHGTDTWSQRVFNSLKWGSPSSPVTTKLYNKTLELKQGEDKPYIRECWQAAGLDPGKDVWRVEFSLSSQMQTLQALKSGEMFKKSILHYDSRERLLRQFYILQRKYFDFRKLQTNRKKDGKLVYVRKYLCPRLELFKETETIPFKPVRNVTEKKRPDRIYKILANKLEQIVEDETSTREEMAAAQTIIAWMIRRMSIERASIHEAQNKLLMIVERAHASCSMDEDTRTWFQEDYERRVMLHLMEKYGIAPRYEDLPF